MIKAEKNKTGASVCLDGSLEELQVDLAMIVHSLYEKMQSDYSGDLSSELYAKQKIFSSFLIGTTESAFLNKNNSPF